MIAIEDPKYSTKRIRYRPIPALTKVSPNVQSPGWYVARDGRVG